MYDEDTIQVAYESVISHLDIIEDELLDRGYMFYDEFEVTDYTARFIPKILNEKYNQNDNNSFYAHETEVENLSYCGIIYNTDVISDRLLLEKIIKEYYTKKYLSMG